MLGHYFDDYDLSYNRYKTYKVCMDMEELLSTRRVYVTFFFVINCLLR